MRTLALLVCASLSAGCSNGGRYLVDAEIECDVGHGYLRGVPPKVSPPVAAGN